MVCKKICFSTTVPFVRQSISGYNLYVHTCYSRENGNAYVPVSQQSNTYLTRGFAFWPGAFVRSTEFTKHTKTDLLSSQRLKRITWVAQKTVTKRMLSSSSALVEVSRKKNFVGHRRMLHDTFQRSKFILGKLAHSSRKYSKVQYLKIWIVRLINTN